MKLLDRPLCTLCTPCLLCSEVTVHHVAMAGVGSMATRIDLVQLTLHTLTFLQETSSMGPLCLPRRCRRILHSRAITRASSPCIARSPWHLEGVSWEIPCMPSVQGVTYGWRPIREAVSRCWTTPWWALGSCCSQTRSIQPRTARTSRWQPLRGVSWT